MKKLAIYVTWVCLLIASCQLEAIGGRGGGGGGRGGGGRSGGMASRGGGGSFNRGGSMNRGAGSARTMNRSPSMSRPSFASVEARNRSLSRPGMGQPGRNPAATKQSFQNFANSHPSNLPSRNRAENRSNAQRPDFRSNQNGVNNVRNAIRADRPNAGRWFNSDFYRSHDNAFNFRGNQAWRWATAAGLSGWLGWDAAPIYDTWGYGGSPVTPTTTSSTTVTPTTSTASTVQQAPAPVQQPQTTAVASSDQNSEWMPLGVFAVANNTQSSTAPNFYIQLAVSKDSKIAGTFYNATTDQTHQVEGIVDKNTQRAIWQAAGKEDSPIVETGLYNLTENEAPLMIYFPDGRVQKMSLIRMEEPPAQLTS